MRRSVCLNEVISRQKPTACTARFHSSSAWLTAGYSRRRFSALRQRSWDISGGIWGASRHALTVGFIAMMVLSVGQRILPAFAGMRLLWSEKLMFAGLLLLTIGCTLRVSCEVLAYQGYAGWAWSVLPVSALIELCGLAIFALNILGTFALQPSHAHPQPVVLGTSELSIGNTAR